MDLIERYNASLRDTEDYYVNLLNRTLDASFNRLVKRTKYYIRNNDIPKAKRETFLLNEFINLVPKFNPRSKDRYDYIFENLVRTGYRKGIVTVDALTKKLIPENRIDISVPIEATLKAAQQARGYMERHGKTFAETSAVTIAQGIAEGRSNDKLIQDLRTRLGVTKVRGDMIVRTETLRAYSQAADDFYKANKVQYIMYYATADDRTCPVCAPRAGQVYERGTISVPIHPRCRCYLAPWINREAQDVFRKRHKADVEKAFQGNNPDGEPVNLSRAAVFETKAPKPVKPTAVDEAR